MGAAWKRLLEGERVEKGNNVLQRINWHLEFLIHNMEKNSYRIPLVELAKMIVNLWKILNNLELLCLQASIVHRRAIPLEVKDFKQQKKKLIDLVLATKPVDDQRKLCNYIGRLATSETNQLADIVRKGLAER